MPAVLTSTKPKVVSASTLAGYRVRNHRNEDLGTIEELMIDPDSGCVAYAVLCFGAFVGSGDKLYAVPWERLQLDPSDRVLIFDWESDRLEGAPCFDQNDWPDFADSSWEREIHNYYGTRPYWFSKAS
jgi:sporulation protein YlmC with PRC-barrel domain